MIIKIELNEEELQKAILDLIKSMKRNDILTLINGSVHSYLNEKGLLRLIKDEVENKIDNMSLHIKKRLKDIDEKIRLADEMLIESKFKKD